MKREYHRWYSPALGKDMELLVFGHAGARVLVFPTSLGKFYEWEDRGMVEGLRDPIERGWIQLFCVDSVDAESWYARDTHPSRFAARHEDYERYLLHEVLPLSEHLNPDPMLITTGASFGAYHAANFAFRFPDRVGRIVAMSGLYDIKRLIRYSDEQVYFHDPSHYLVNENSPDRLAALRRIDIIVCVGEGDPNRADNEHLSHVLWSKGIWHAFRIWDGWAHDWPWWRQMIALYIGGHD